MASSRKIHTLLYPIKVLCILIALTSPQQILDGDDVERQESCLALSLSGGGAKGAYEVGVLSELTRLLNGTKKMEYDVVSGISVGSINAAGLSLFEKGKEIEASAFLKDLWLNLTSSDIWQYWEGFEPYEAIMKKSGFLDNAPMKKLLTNIFTAKEFKIQRELITGAIDADSGRLVVTDFASLAHEEFVPAIVSSASVPGVFPFTDFQGMRLVDSLASGWNVNMVSAIQKCMERVQDHSRITLDVIVMYPDRINRIESTGSTISNWRRKQEFKSYYGLLSDIAEFMKAYPEINYRYFVQASETPLPSYDLLSFSPANSERCIALGTKDAQRVVEMGEGESFRQFERDFTYSVLQPKSKSTNKARSGTSVTI